MHQGSQPVSLALPPPPLAGVVTLPANEQSGISTANVELLTAQFTQDLGLHTFAHIMGMEAAPHTS